MTRSRLVEEIWRDVIHSIRSLSRSPTYTAAATLTLAVGVGAAITAFTVVDRVLLSPLPYPNANRVYSLYETSNTGNGRLASYLTFRDWQQGSSAVGRMAYVRGKPVDMMAKDGAVDIGGAFVSPGFFQVVQPPRIIGRTFTPEEEATGSHVAVLTYTFCEQRFGGEPASALGQTLRLAGGDYTVVGVLPPDYRYPAWADTYFPLQAIAAADTSLSNRAMHVDSRVVVVLAPNTRVAVAHAWLGAIERRLAAEYPNESGGWDGVKFVPLKEEVLGFPPGPGFGDTVERSLVLLTAAVGLVLLLACANLASLATARVSWKAHELAVRQALGAGRLRIIRHVLIESGLLATIGTGAGLMLSELATRGMGSWLPVQLPRVREVSIGMTTICFAVVAAAVITCLVGLAPSIQSTTTDPVVTLRTGGRASGGRSRVRSSVVATEVALALVLLVGAGLLGRSFWQLTHLDLGFNPTRVVTVGVFPPSQKYSGPEGATPLYRRLEEAVASVPGIAQVGLTNNLPLGGGVRTPILANGAVAPTGHEPSALFREASVGYFATMDIRVVSGRGFTSRDMAADAHVAVVNEALARRLWPDGHAIGSQIAVRRSAQGRADLGQWFHAQVVGVVGNVRDIGLESDPAPEVYVPYPVNPWGHMALVIRASGNPAPLLNGVRHAILGVEPDLPGIAAGGSGVALMTNALAAYVAGRRFTLLLLVGFAAGALFLAGLGIYGVVAYSVVQRRREIGIRAALGASRLRITRQILSQSLAMVATGLALGLVISFGFAHLVGRVLFGTSPTDPVTFVAVAVLLLAVAICAAYIPARRASGVDAMEAIRSE